MEAVEETDFDAGKPAAVAEAASGTRAASHGVDGFEVERCWNASPAAVGKD